MAKVLIAINKLAIGGAEKVAVTQARQLTDDGHQVYLATLYETNKVNLESEVNFLGERQLCFRSNSLFDWAAYKRIKKFLQDEQIEVVVSHLFDANTILRLAAMSVGVPVRIAYEHSDYKKRFWQRLMDSFLARFSTLVGISDHVIKATAKSEWIKESKFKMIPHLVSTPEFSKGRRDELRSELGLKQGDLCVLSIGRFVPDKDQKRLIDIAAKSSDPSIKFILVGYGPLEGELQEYLIKSEVSNLQIIAAPTKAAEYLAAADIFILTSKREGVPVTILEAMLSKVVPLAPDRGGIPEVMQSDSYGHLIDPTKSSDVAGLVIRLGQERSRLVEMGKKAKLRAHEYMNENGTLDGLIKDLLDVANN